MYQLGENKREYLKNKITDGAKKYKKFLVGKIFLIVCEDGETYNVRFLKNDFIHLVGVCSDLSYSRFFENGAKGILDRDNIDEDQKYNWSTLKAKADSIENIDKIIYGKSENSLFMINLKTNTYTYPIAIRNKDINSCIGFKDKINKARTLRKYTTSNDADEQKRIIAIFSTTSANVKYDELVYLSNFDELVKVNKSVLKKVNDKLVQKIKPLHTLSRKKIGIQTSYKIGIKTPICFRNDTYSEKLKRIKLKNRMR